MPALADEYVAMRPRGLDNSRGFTVQNLATREGWPATNILRSELDRRQKAYPAEQISMRFETPRRLTAPREKPLP